MSNKRVLAIHFRDSLFAQPGQPVLFLDKGDKADRLKPLLFTLGLLALAIISLGPA